jgi:hypothetical protein
MSGSLYADQMLNDYHRSMIYGISGAPTTFINGRLYAMSGLELLGAVKTILQAQGPIIEAMIRFCCDNGAHLKP